MFIYAMLNTVHTMQRTLTSILLHVNPHCSKGAVSLQLRLNPSVIHAVKKQEQEHSITIYVQMYWYFEKQN